MEDDFAYPKSNLKSTRNSKGRGSQGKSKFHGEKKRKWEKPPHNKEKQLLQKKKSKAKVSSKKCYTYRSVDHLAKMCTKPNNVSPNLRDSGFIAKASLTKEGTNFIMLRSIVNLINLCVCWTQELCTTS